MEKIRETDGSSPVAVSRIERVKRDLGANVQLFPLFAAVWAPVSTLLDIAGVCERWFLLDGTDVADPAGCLVLGAFGLVFNIIANALLVARFTVSEKWWRRASAASVICWIIKVVLSLVNFAVYGALKNNKPGYAHTDGFWAAAFSGIIAGIITGLLVVHWITRRTQPSSAGAEIRVFGAHFIMSVMCFIALLGAEALIFAKIEHWTYLEGVYFSLVTAFTIGFGDFEPMTTASRVLLFPFAVLSIALLAVQINILVNFASEKAKSHKAHWRASYEKESEENLAQNGKKGKRLTLVEEMAGLQELERQEEIKHQRENLVASFTALVVFWLIGGAVFMAIEGWTFGVSMYFCYVFFLTVGYGDFSPSSGAGRVFFIVYSLLAVPIVTNFVLSTVSGTFSTVADRSLQKERDKRAPTEAETRKYHSHAYYVDEASGRLDSHMDERRDDHNEAERELTKIVMGLAIRLEAEARTIILEATTAGSKAHDLLRADRRLQLRARKTETKKEEENEKEKGKAKPIHVEVLRVADITLAEDVREEASQAEDEAANTDILEQVRRYRQTFGALLAAGSRLLALEGDDQLQFEGRLPDEVKDDHGGMLLGSGRQGPAEKAMGVDV